MSDVFQSSDLIDRRQEMAAVYREGDLDRLETMARALLVEHPDDIEAHRYLARIYTNRHEPEQAQPFWERLTELTPEEPEPYLQLARIERRKRNWEPALRHAQELLARQPDNTEIRTIELEALVNLKKGDAIGEAIARLVEATPEDAMPFFRKAFTVDLGDAVAAPLRALADSGDEEAIKLCAEQSEAQRTAAARHEIQRNPFRAAACYRVMRTLDPSSGFGTSALLRLRKPFLERAREAYAEGDDKRAISHARNSIKIEPREEEPYLIIGRSALRTDEPQIAYEALREGLMANEHTVWLTLNYARAAERSEHLLEAFEAYSAVLASDDPEAAKHAEEAQRSVDRLPGKLVSAAVSDIREGNPVAAIETALTLQQSGVLDEKAAEYLRNNVVTHGQRKLREFYDAGDRTGLALGRGLMRFAPDEPYAFRVVGRMLLRDRNYGEAAEVWGALVDQDGENVEFRLNLARSLQRMGDKPGAAAAATELLRLDPEHAEGKQILESATVAA
ncbi:tetratricopeptide repeat protein [Sphingomicrobium astaxanthinifaciens]|uniref:tetratricopeptide repeat protein n=1 Tax=Sphingomicrobium astaxanthinifaciens TaxID=1227949 RepID=UPI001FCC04CD|nr:tetratricopeptide repeat protein [Sphingomicrobium astaxanthinifaciens]MCJ7420797.1 hypothetical protein [Sphingomicrobium astaxanthinifaciens]